MTTGGPRRAHNERRRQAQNGRDELAFPSAFAAPALTCDVVMKGGLTSGVVYPRATAQLARRYRFRSIGGTSAGAIAAAGAAAAEHRRQNPGEDSPGSGFAALAAIPAELGRPDEDGQPLLLRLFRPEPHTAPLFELVTAATASDRGAIARAALRALPGLRAWLLATAAATVALVALVGALLTAGDVPLLAAVLLLVLVYLAALAAVALAVGVGAAGDLRRHIPRLLGRNAYGICTLGADGALTPWLHERLQAIAGRPGDAPLTFGDLWGRDAPDGICPVHGTSCPQRSRLPVGDRRRRDVACRVIDLQLITTNLTTGRPLRLPVREQPDGDLADGGGLLFDPAELTAFFPPEVAAVLADAAPAPDERTRPLLDAAVQAARQAGSPTPPDTARLRYLPLNEGLPVLVAVRMSLSFPGLLSALPFWQLQYLPAPAAPRLVRVWYSDGGITSNFPVHFFDQLVPTRPTFAFNLTSFGPHETADLHDPAKAVQMAREVSDGALEQWAEIGSPWAFALAVKDAMQNWRDSAQAGLPGYRERIVHIKLAQGEGGLNLAMDEAVIARLAERGSYAGRLAAEAFSGPLEAEPQRTALWNDHRYARVRVALAALEQAVRSLDAGAAAPPDAATMPLDERLAHGQRNPPYPFDAASRRKRAEDAIAAYHALVEAWPEPDEHRLPRPRPELRIGPPY